MLNESKLYGYNIKEYINYLGEFKNNTWIWFDTETTGLSPKEYQITQIAAIATNYDLKKLDSFNEKAKLTDETKEKIKREKENPNPKKFTVQKALALNRYGDYDDKYIEEDVLLTKFSDWVNGFNNPILVAYNNTFDMKMVNTRVKEKIHNIRNLDIMKMVQLFWIPMHEKLAEEGNEKSQHIINTLGRSSRSNLVGTKLGNIAGILGVASENWHDAYADIEMTLNIYKAIYQDLNKNYMAEINKYKAKRIGQYKYFDKKRKMNR